MRVRMFRWAALLAALLVPLLLTAPSNAVTLAWDPNSEPDLAGYKLYYGYEPGVYHETIDVGFVTEYEVTGLALGQGYYFAVTAYDNEDPVLESGFSYEVFYYEPIPSGLVGSIIAYVTEQCEQEMDTTDHGDGYEVIFTMDKIIIIHDNLDAGDNIRLGF